MAKYDSVDRLMKLATDEATQPAARGADAGVPVRSAGEAAGGPEPNAEAVLEARVSRSEPGVTGGPKAAAVGVPPSPLPLAEPAMSPAERGRQVLGALRPFLPAVGSALRLVDHGAVQAVARLLPVLGGLSTAPIAKSATMEEQRRTEVLAAGERRYSELAAELKAYKQRVETLEEQLRRQRENLERVGAEQGSLSHLARQLADRSRLLTAVTIILVMVVAAELVLLAIFLHR